MAVVAGLGAAGMVLAPLADRVKERLVPVDAAAADEAADIAAMKAVARVAASVGVQLVGHAARLSAHGTRCGNGGAADAPSLCLLERLVLAVLLAPLDL